MGKRDDARVFLSKLYLCIPRSFYYSLEATHRGFGFVLHYLQQSDREVFAGDFAKELNVSTARVAVLLKRMEQSGYITRHSSSKDARRTVVEITPAGAAYVKELREQTLKKVEALLDQVSIEDLETYIRISNQMREAMGE